MTNKHSPTPELLRLFVLTAKHGSIAAAARVENVAPSVATRKIAQLESALGVRLFERTTRSTKMTEAGSVALKWATAALDAQAQVLDDLHAVQGDPSGIVRMVATQYAASVLLPPVLAAFTSKYPKIQLSISTTDSLVNLVAGGYDVAIHSGRIPDSSVVGQRLFELNRVLCATPEYLKKHGVPTRPSDLEHHLCLAHSVNEARNWFFRNGKKVFSQPIEPLIETDEYSVLLGLTRYSIGISRLAKTLVKDDLATGKLVQLLPQFKCVYPDGELPGLWLLYPSRRVLHRTRLLINFITENLGSGSSYQ